jgi:DNA polymerase III subunit epsilon
MTEYYTFWDTETTGKLAPEHKIVQINFRLFNPDSREEFKNITLWINPERNIPVNVQEIHHITNDMVKSKPTFIKVIPVINKILSQTKLLIAHNGDSFDVPFLAQEYESCGQVIPDVKTFDTMLTGRNVTPMGKYPNLRELCECYDVEYDPMQAHRADYDTVVMSQAFFKALDLGWIEV